MTKILRCRCVHGFQDREHGIGRRVHNSGDHKPDEWKCTVCGDKKTAKGEK